MKTYLKALFPSAIALVFLISACDFAPSPTAQPTPNLQPTIDVDALVAQKLAEEKKEAEIAAEVERVMSSILNVALVPTPTIPAPTPIPAAVATPTPTPWPMAMATPWPTSTATPLPLPTAAPPTPRPTPRPTATPVSRWAEIQRDYRDGRITYDQAVEKAIDAGLSRPQARIALAQIRIP